MLAFLTHFHTKINSRWIKDLKVMHEVMKIWMTIFIILV